jgi:hypothetical protein
MPILMIALFALAVFGLIGVLLAAAVVLATKRGSTGDEAERPRDPASRPAA